MPPLTLEQVLARSMRLPRKNASKNISSSSTGTGSTNIGVNDDNSINNNWLGKSLSSSIKPVRGDKNIAKLFDLIEKDEAALTANRPTIQQSHNLIRNSQDLLSYLHTAKQMRAWEDALRSFSEATKIFLIKETNNCNESPLILPKNIIEGNTENEGATANIAHISVLLDTCAAAKKWNLIEQLGEFFRKESPKVLIDTVTILAKTKESDVDNGKYGWKRAIEFLQTRIPPEEQPVDAYNICISACESALDWEGAFSIIRSMGPNAIQNFDPNSINTNISTNNYNNSLDKENNENALTSSEKENLTNNLDLIDESGITKAQPPVPNVVTYATLISVLEQSGKEALASEVLQRLPPVEKEEITATYAALIHVWSEQKSRNRRRRF